MATGHPRWLARHPWTKLESACTAPLGYDRATDVIPDERSPIRQAINAQTRLCLPAAVVRVRTPGADRRARIMRKRPHRPSKPTRPAQTQRPNRPSFSPCARPPVDSKPVRPQPPIDSVQISFKPVSTQQQFNKISARSKSTQKTTNSTPSIQIPVGRTYRAGHTRPTTLPTIHIARLRLPALLNHYRRFQGVGPRSCPQTCSFRPILFQQRLLNDVRRYKRLYVLTYDDLGVGPRPRGYLWVR